MFLKNSRCSHTLRFHHLPFYTLYPLNWSGEQPRSLISFFGVHFSILLLWVSGKEHSLTNAVLILLSQCLLKHQHAVFPNETAGGRSPSSACRPAHCNEPGACHYIRDVLFQ